MHEAVDRVVRFPINTHDTAEKNREVALRKSRIIAIGMMKLGQMRRFEFIEPICFQT